MDADRTGWVPLPDIGDTYRAERAGAHRDSIGRARRVSNWAAAALIVSTGAAALALAHQALPAIAPASGIAAPGAGPGSPAGARGASGPTVNHSVATTSASGVTTTTTTRPVNGKTVVTQVRNVPAHGDI